MKSSGPILTAPLFAFMLAAIAQAPDQSQLPELPPEPHCISLYRGSPCDVLKQQYNDAAERRQKAELAAYVEQQKANATAPLQQQISLLQTQIEQLQVKIQQQTVAAAQAKQDAHQEGFWRGVAYSSIAFVIVGVLAVTVRALTQRFTLTRRQSAAAGPG